MARKATLKEKEQEFKNTTIEGVGRNVASHYGMKPEDIFAVFGREHISGFVKMWNNSLSTSISESMAPLVQEIKELRTEVEYLREENKELRSQSMDTSEIEGVIVETLMSCMKGLMKGISEGMAPEKSSLELLVEDIMSTSALVSNFEEESSLSSVSRSIGINDHEKVDAIPRNHRGIDWEYISDKNMMMDVLFKLLSIAEDEGVDVSVGKQFKTHGSDFNGAYQRFMKANVGTKGAWNSLVEEYQTTKIK